MRTMQIVDAPDPPADPLIALSAFVISEFSR